LNTKVFCNICLVRLEIYNHSYFSKDRCKHQHKKKYRNVFFQEFSNLMRNNKL